MTIRNKLYGSFLLLALIVLAAGVVGVLMVGKVARSGNVVLQDKVPLKDVSLEAMLAASTAVENCQELMQARDGMEVVETRIDQTLGELDMFISMIRYGTDSEEFRNSAAGTTYGNGEHTHQVARGSEEMQSLVHELIRLESSFADQTRALTAAHRNKLRYSFDYDGREYDLDTFFLYAHVKHGIWFDALRKSVAEGTEFKKQLDPTKCWHGRWIGSFRTDDNDLASLLDEFQEKHVHLHQVGADVVAASTDQKPAVLASGTHRLTTVTAQCDKITEYGHGRIMETRQREHEHANAMLETGQSMIAKLKELGGIADAEMEQANQASMSTKRFAYTLLTVFMFGAVTLGIILGSRITQSIVAPLSKGVELARAIARGDLTRKLEITSKDEIGELSEALNKMSSDLHGIISDLATNSNTLSSSAKDLTAISEQIADSAEETSSQAGTVSATAKQISGNVDTVAAASEEMTASIGEIAKNATDSASVARAAVNTASNANAMVSRLGDNSKEIGNVIKVITSIAEQTNLLALNATIEAARAGEAGKGFAVVANEVKELASQTNQATEDISGKIAVIQSDTRSAVDVIHEITSIIRQIDELSCSIASAVEEQTATTAEVGRNISEVAIGTRTIVDNVNGVAEAAHETSAGSTQTQESATELARLAANLESVIQRFNC